MTHAFLTLDTGIKLGTKSVSWSVAYLGYGRHGTCPWAQFGGGHGGRVPPLF